MIELKLSRQSRHPILHCYSYFIDLYFSYCWTLWLKLSTLWQEFFCNPKLCQTYIVSWNSIFPPSKILPSSNFFPHCEIFLPKFGGNFPGGNIPPNSRSWNWPQKCTPEVFRTRRRTSSQAGRRQWYLGTFNKCCVYTIYAWGCEFQIQFLLLIHLCLE